MARVPHRDRQAPAAVPPREGDGAPAHPGRPADRLPQPRRGHPHRAQGGGAEAGPHEALQADRPPGRGDPRNQAAASREARRDEDPRRAEGTGRGAGHAREDAEERGEAQQACPRGAGRGLRGLRRRAQDEIVERAAAQAIDETELVTAEPVTVVLSTLGWVRQARGHDVDPEQLSYKTGDAFQAAATRPQHAAGRVHRLDRSRLLAAGARLAVRARARANRCRAGSIRPKARPSPRC